MNKNSKKSTVGKDAKKQKDLAKAKDLTGKAVKVKKTIKTRASGRPPCCTTGCADSSYE